MAVTLTPEQQDRFNEKVIDLQAEAISHASSKNIDVANLVTATGVTKKMAKSHENDGPKAQKQAKMAFGKAATKAEQNTYTNSNTPANKLG